MVRFVHLRLFVYLRLMSWKHLQSLFQIHIINYLKHFLAAASLHLHLSRLRI